jgi:hypothetical protein
MVAATGSSRLVYFNNYPVMIRLSFLCLLLVEALPSTVHGFPSKRLISNPFDGRKRVLLHPPPRHDDHEDDEANGDEETNTTDSNNAVADAVPSLSTELSDDNHNNNMVKNATSSTTTTSTISSVGKWLTTLHLWVGAAFVLMALFLRAFHIW